MKNLLTFLLLFFFTACAVVKVPQVVSGSKADGIIKLAYEYNNFEAPKVEWETAKANAKKRCLSWGYSDVEFFDAGVKTCLTPSGGGCTLWRVVYECQCIN